MEKCKELEMSLSTYLLEIMALRDSLAHLREVLEKKAQQIEQLKKDNTTMHRTITHICVILGQVDGVADPLRYACKAMGDIQTLRMTCDRYYISVKDLEREMEAKDDLIETLHHQIEEMIDPYVIQEADTTKKKVKKCRK